MKARILNNVKGMLACGVIGIIFWLFPYVVSLGCTVAEFYLKYRAVGMTMFALTIVFGINTLVLFKKWNNSEDNNA